MKDVAAVVPWKHWLDGVCVLPAVPIVYAVVNFTRLSPNDVTRIGFVVGLAAALLVATGQWTAAAAVYAVWFVLDACDGAAARVTRQCSTRGAILDLRCDRVVFGASIVAHAAQFTARGMAVETMLAVSFAMLLYVVDVFWMYKPGEGLPAEAAEASAVPERRTTLQTLSLYETRLRVTPWICEILFFVAAPLAPSLRRALYGVAISGVAWAFAIDSFARPLLWRLRRPAGEA